MAAALSGCEKASMSDADRAFDTAFSAAMNRGLPIDLVALETGPWSLVCAVGEERPAGMMPGEKARLGEGAFDEFIDGAFLAPGDPGGGALAFRYPDGVEVRPLSHLTINMGSPINRCVARREAVLVNRPDTGWRFRDYPVGD
ncbi:hypothetical protein [Caulobacter sp.]|uniref:hypothetical protein n=1 Tax=Caulobacter sp. TaxID=78 RepID=UPI003BB09231